MNLLLGLWGAVLELRNMTKCQWCSDISNIGFQNFRKSSYGKCGHYGFHNPRILVSNVSHCPDQSISLHVNVIRSDYWIKLVYFCYRLKANSNNIWIKFSFLFGPLVDSYYLLFVLQVHTGMLPTVWPLFFLRAGLGRGEEFHCQPVLVGNSSIFIYF